MPNWCNNTITLTHENKEMLVRAVKSLADGTFCSEFLPCPQELLDAQAPNRSDNTEELTEKYGHADWYSWCVANWGTKWDISACSASMSDGEVSGGFDTAWAPPIALYQHLESLGFKVEAMYYEPGCCYAGTYSDGFDDYYDFSNLSADDIAEQLPADLDQEFCISESMFQWEEEQGE